MKSLLSTVDDRMGDTVRWFRYLALFLSSITMWFSIWCPFKITFFFTKCHNKKRTAHTSFFTFLTKHLDKQCRLFINNSKAILYFFLQSFDFPLQGQSVGVCFALILHRVSRMIIRSTARRWSIVRLTSRIPTAVIYHFSSLVNYSYLIEWQAQSLS